MHDSAITEYALSGGSKERKPKRPPGRPIKRTAGFYEAMREDYMQLGEWFEEVFGRPPKSDVELLNAKVDDELKRQGKTNIASPNVQGRLKTLRNELGKAKKFKPVPLNWLFIGQKSTIDSIEKSKSLTRKER